MKHLNDFFFFFFFFFIINMYIIKREINIIIKLINCFIIIIIIINIYKIIKKYMTTLKVILTYFRNFIYLGPEKSLLFFFNFSVL